MFGYSLVLGKGATSCWESSYQNEELISLYSKSDHNFSFELDLLFNLRLRGKSKFDASLSHSDDWLYSGLPDHESFVDPFQF